jgi:ribosomal protein L22
MSVDEPDETTSEEAPAVEPETSAAASSSRGVEAASADDAPAPAEPDTAAVADSSQGASSEDAPSTAEDDDVEEQDDETEADDEAGTEAEDEPVVVAEPAAKTPARSATPTRRRQRGQREPGAPAPVVRAQAKYVRSSARKARLVCDHIRGKSVEEARAILALTPRAIARDWSKLLESAVANAEHNHELVGEDLYVKAVHADEGPTIKRFRPRAMGRATPIRKRTSHLTILLTPKD